MTDDRKETWLRIRTLFDAAWKDHGLDAGKIALLEQLGLQRHQDAALLVAAEIILKECRFPPAPADWFARLEARATRKEVSYRKDCWGRTILGRDGAPIIASMRDVYEEPRVYSMLGMSCPVQLGDELAHPSPKLLP